MMRHKHDTIMSMFREDRPFIFIILFIISLLLCFDLFVNNARPASFDGLTHVTNIAQYYQALKDGDFPVRWQDGFANYGMPIPIFGHQITSYVGALFTFITRSPLLSFNILIFIGAFISSIGMYLFLRSYFDKYSALFGTILFCLSPYRIINIYIRGAAPEFFSSLFFPFILMTLKKWTEENKLKHLIMFIVLTGLLIQTHPIAAMIQFLFITPYYLFTLKGFTLKRIVIFGVSLIASLGLASYYVIPLLLEFKYFYYGAQSELFLPNQFLTIKNFFFPNWFYFYEGDIFTRGHFLHIGSIEMIIVFISIFALIINIKMRSKSKPLAMLSLGVFFLYSLLMTSFASILYIKIKLLGNVQHQWRMLSGLLFIPPILGSFLLSNLNEKFKKFAFVLAILFLVVLRFPQIYGKNYMVEESSKYYKNSENLYATVYNTIWTGKTEDYPIKKTKGAIISGSGRITNRSEHNSWRTYQVDAQTQVRMADYTFYFPGWKAYVDGTEVPIEFQDVNYRGVITYLVPPGKHTVLVKFTDTKVRLIANIISMVFILSIGVLIIFRKKLSHHSTKKSS